MKRTVLLIDDDPIFCKLFKSVVEKYINKNSNMEIYLRIYNDAEAGLKAILKNGFSLAIIDLNLKNSDIDGFKLSRECFLAGKPVIISTAQTLPSKLYFQLINFGLKKNFEWYEKSMKLEDMVEKIKKLINKKISSDEIRISLKMLQRKNFIKKNLLSLLVVPFIYMLTQIEKLFNLLQ